MGWKNKVLVGDVRDVLKSLPKKSCQACLTSPPYWQLRDYAGGVDEIGSEPTPQEFIETLVGVFRLVRSRLRDDGVLFLNIGDTYASEVKGSGGTNPVTSPFQASKKGGSANFQAFTPRPVDCGRPDKNLLMIPARLAIALQDDGWFLRNEIIWHAPNKMPESARDRCSRAHEKLYILTKRPDYYFDQYAVREPCSPATAARYRSPFGGSKNDQLRDAGYREVTKGYWDDAPDDRVPRDVWTVPIKGTKQLHFATMPQALAKKCLLAGTSAKGACAACGAPWKRILERVREATRPGDTSKVVTSGKNGKEVGNRDPERHTTRVRMLGWKRTCDCHCKDVVPCVVLEPFLGSGTTAIVARNIGRDWVGFELNEKYAAMAERRIGRADAGLGLF